MTQQTPAIFSNRGLASYGEASPEYELAPLGIASMQDQVQRLAEFGRNGDIYVIHAAEGETVIPMEVLDENPQIKALLFNQMAEMGLDPQRYVVGDQLNSLNPVTGMPEFFISSIWRGVKKVVKKVVKIAKKIAPIALPIIGAMVGLPFLGPMFAAGSMASMALTSGIGTLIGGGSLKDSFKSALIAGGTAGIMGGLKGFMGAPEGAGFSGFTAGVKSAATGQIPIYDAKGAVSGWQAPPEFRQILDKPSLAFSGEEGKFSPMASRVPLPAQLGPLGEKLLPALNPEMIVPPGDLLPPGFTRYAPRVPGGESSPGWSLKNFFGGTDKKAAAAAAAVDPAIAKIGRAEKILERALTAPEKLKIIETTAVADAGGSMFGDLSPTKLLRLSEKGSTVGDTALIGGGLYLGAKALGADPFEEAEEESVEEVRAQARAALDPIVIDKEAARLAQINVGQPFIPTTRAQDLLQPTIFNEAGQFIGARVPVAQIAVAAGGSVNYPERDLLVEGPGTEKSDDIPAMLSDGEFVMNSQAVRGADPSGGGNRYAGAQNLYNIMRNFEMRA